MTRSEPQPETIEKLFNQAFPSFALLAGMQLDLFTPLKDGSLSADQLADALGVSSTKLELLLYALVGADLLTLERDLFSNSTEADNFLVQGRPGTASPGANGGPFCEGIAKALGWEHGSARILTVETQTSGGMLNLTRAFIGTGSSRIRGAAHG